MDAIDLAYIISYVLGASLAAACVVLCLRVILLSSASRARGRAASPWEAGEHGEGPRPYYLLTGFYACIFLCDAFLLLSMVLGDYPYVISPGDLSWVGGIVFLIAVALCLTDTWNDAQRKASHRFRLRALIAPAVCICFNIAYIAIYPELLFNYLLYGIPTAILSWYALWQYLAGARGGVRPSLQRYQLAVLLWILAQLCYDLFSTLGTVQVAAWAVIYSYLITVCATCFYFAVRKGEQM